MENKIRIVNISESVRQTESQTEEDTYCLFYQMAHIVYFAVPHVHA